MLTSLAMPRPMPPATDHSTKVDQENCALSGSKTDRGFRFRIAAYAALTSLCAITEPTTLATPDSRVQILSDVKILCTRAFATAGPYQGQSASAAGWSPPLGRRAELPFLHPPVVACLRPNHVLRGSVPPTVDDPGRGAGFGRAFDFVDIVRRVCRLQPMAVECTDGPAQIVNVATTATWSDGRWGTGVLVIDGNGVTATISTR